MPMIIFTAAWKQSAPNTVRGTPEFGPDSSFYRSLGYVTQSERKTHKTKPKPTS